MLRYPLCRLSLTSPDAQRPQTPVMVTSFSKADSIAGQFAMRLKSFLRRNKHFPPRDSYENEGEILTAKTAARSLYNVPNVPPPGSHLGEYVFDSLLATLPSIATLSDQRWQCT